VPVHRAGFAGSNEADYWLPLVRCQGPVGEHAARLTPDLPSRLMDVVRVAYLSDDEDKLRSMTATAASCAASSLNPAEEGFSPMKLSARNQIKGRVVDVTKGATTSHVRIDIGNGVVITSSITNEAVDDLGLKVGDEATAIIKASDVMVAT
jgi:molybdopterin-binding protein